VKSLRNALESRKEVTFNLKLDILPFMIEMFGPLEVGNEIYPIEAVKLSKPKFGQFLQSTRSNVFALPMAVVNVLDWQDWQPRRRCLRAVREIEDGQISHEDLRRPSIKGGVVDNKAENTVT
jgi:hypothetical protein